MTTQDHGPETEAGVVSDLERRQRRLSQAVALAVGEGWRIDSQSESMAVMVRGSRPNHILHVILSVLTFGVWLVVWGALALFGGEKRRLIFITESGEIQISDV